MAGCAVAGAAALHGGRCWPLGASGRRGRELRRLLGARDAIELCLFDASGRRSWRACAAGAQRRCLARPAARRRRRAGLRPAGPRPLAPRARPALQPAQAAARPLRARDRRPLRLERPARRRRPDAPAAHGPARQRRVALKARVVHDRFDWQGDTPPRHAAGRHRAVRAARARLHASPPGRARAVARHLRRAGLGGGRGAPAAPGRHGRQPAAGAPVPGRAAPGRARPAQPLGLQHARLLLPRAALRRAGRAARDEFRRMVRRLHAAGIEVVLDVVYNHTAEGDETAPRSAGAAWTTPAGTACAAGRSARYENHTGCGNTLDLRHPRVLQMVMDSLRYWVQEMHVDGFRFDLAPVLGRGDHGFDRDGGLLQGRVAQDPVLARRQADRRALGHRPRRLPAGPVSRPAGWNGTTASATPCAPSGWAATARAASSRSGCARRPTCSSAWPRAGESVNFVVSHDGFTLRDLVSYDHAPQRGQRRRTTATATATT
jgi:glycogen debranching enzyme